MDALFKLRLFIWALIIGLWGVMVYQYLGQEEQAEEAPMMRPVSGLYKGRMPENPAPEPQPAPPPEQVAQEPLPPQNLPGADLQATPADSSALAAAADPARPDPRLDFIKPLAPKLPPMAPPRVSRPTPIRREAPVRQADLPAPPGFIKSQTRHFNVYAEHDPASEEFLQVLENLHGNLMLDLSAFSPWAREEKVSIFLFHNQETYRKVTGRPPWSGGASSVPKRKIYVYESDELESILAHELCHIYYDGFYLGSRPDPLWLSEGMATLIQVERGLAAPNWLKDNLDILRRQGGYSLPDLMRVSSTSGASDENVRLWYTESYSLVRFLIRSQYKSSFYNFSRYLREGKSVSEALYRAYGMPYTNIKALEYAWRYDVTTNNLSNLARDQR